ncbi:hypothetical protein D9Q98_002151 [Chlorella vulgaris]|uniref:Lon protease homolog n=1 Tax=Chlorella vulgaris TaxID=3077 RepID=A0A9D4Z0M7_CHLVU|nr:hypothetical protein D9Q98_002151 [Chlorella vulgaris]
MRGSGSQALRLPEGEQGGGATDLPLLPLFDAVLLPGGVMRVTIAPGTSTALVEMLLRQQGGQVLVAAVPYLRSRSGGKVANIAALAAPSSEEHGSGDHLDLDQLHSFGTAARVLQLVRHTQSGGWTVTLEGRCRLRVCSVHLSSHPSQAHYEATVEQLDYYAGPAAAVPSSPAAVSAVASQEQEELSQQLLKGTRRLFVLLQGESEGREAAARVARGLAPLGPSRIADVLGSLVARALPDRLALLAELDVTSRLQMVVRLLGLMLDAAEKAATGGAAPRGRSRRSGGTGSTRAGSGSRGLRLPPGLSGSAAGDDQGEEEDEEEDSKRELAHLMDKLRRAAPPAEVMRAAQREYRRLQRGSDAQPGYLMSLNYLETLADLPWSRHSGQAPPTPPVPPPLLNGGEGDLSVTPLPPRLLAARAPLALEAVRQRLDEAHYGLDKVKERIVQYVAVQRLRGWDARAPILCFIGPPGVGKTSLARSIAEVLGRPFQRISLGGVRDEAEVRGHRRTYIGAMPGRVIQAIRKAGVRDPLMLLDEVDKLGRDAARGDPAAALLEVLDPEQNTSFVDTYLGLPFDLSSCLFVATANRGADIPAALLDRLEVVQLGGYTREEKVHIAERHLIPRLLTEHGLHQGQLVFPPAAVRSLIEGWTREAGVRSLARGLAAVCRHVAVQVVQQAELQQQELIDGGLDSSTGAGQLNGENAPESEPESPPELESQASRGGSHGQASCDAEQSGPGALATALGRGRTSRSLLQQPTARQPRRGPALRNKASGRGSGSGAGLHLQQSVFGRTAGLKLWAELAPLAGSLDSGAVGAVLDSHLATGGYQGLRLHEPLSANTAAGSLGAAGGGSGGAEDCSCSHRKHQGWFSWLRWPRQDGTAEQQQQQQQPEAGGPSCSCDGRCNDYDCCCATAVSSSVGQRSQLHGMREQQHPSAAAGATHGSICREAGQQPGLHHSRRGSAATSKAAVQAEHPRLCGPGSMQVVPPSPLPGAAASGNSPVQEQQVAALAQSGCVHQLAITDAGQQPKAWQLKGPAGGGAELGQGQQQQQHQQLQRQQLPQVVVDDALLEAVLGPARFEGHCSSERVVAPGTAAGLVWTAVGGKVQYIECICVGAAPAGGGGSRAGGHLTLTGQLGEVLEESARIALSWVRAHAVPLGLPGGSSCPSRTWDVHIHLPAGAVPKDGPSAGVTLAVALISLFTERCVRADTAMTGELTLRGLVLPVGGIKEKLLAAQAAGMTRVLIPARNLPDVLAEVPAEVREVLEVIPCKRLEEVLQDAFDPPLNLAQPIVLARL